MNWILIYLLASCFERFLLDMGKSSPFPNVNHNRGDILDVPVYVDDDVDWNRVVAEHLMDTGKNLEIKLRSTQTGNYERVLELAGTRAQRRHKLYVTYVEDSCWNLNKNRFLPRQGSTSYIRITGGRTRNI